MNLRSSYQREDFLIFLNDFLPSFQRDVRSANSTGSHSLTKSQYLGRCPELDLEVYEFAHGGSGDKRVSLTRDGFRVMKNHAAYRALAIFYSEDTQDWRLSLMTASPDINPKGQVDLSFSNPRRYSFFLGPEARVNTPKKYLLNLGSVKDLNDLLQRFNVEVVTKEFFSNYRKLYENLSTYLEKDRAFQAVASESEFGTDNFAKKLLGQIVFLYFVQRKGWLGAKAEDSVTKGDQNFMRNLFNRCVEENKNFFNDFLEPLFYDALNRRPERAGSFYRELFRGQIPFLNGGLFEPLQNYDWKASFLHIPNEIFSTDSSNPEQGDGILDVFDLYNFTVDESDAVDQEVSVDPEMLGKVFENLLPENLRKGKGTYYTPREIVHYMCHESLIKHLANDTDIEEKKIRDLANLYEIPLVEGEFKTATYWEGEKDEVLNSLSSIRIVDPACGSGAFLIGMLQEIVKLNHVLEPKVDDYQLRRKVIENNLYGVDIDPGAVEIAKLRLWLALVVDYELPIIEPLPNLDYKIMQGNSLIEEFEGVNFYQEPNKSEAPTLIDFSSEREDKIHQLERKKKEYFSAVNSDKKSVKQKIDELIKWLVQDSLAQRAESLRQQWSKHAYAEHQLSGKQWSEYYMKNIQNVLARGKLDDEIKNVGNPKHAKSYFLWKLFFIEVFEEKGGFDVVIANPPYIFARSSSEKGITAENKKYYYEHFSLAKYQVNLYPLFIERATSLLKSLGCLAFITPNNWLTINTNKDLRQFILTKSDITIINFKAQVFESAAVDSAVFLLVNSDGNQTVDLYEWSDRLVEITEVPSNYFLKQKDFVINVDLFKGSGGVIKLLSKIEENSTDLGSIADVKVGLKAYQTGKGKPRQTEEIKTKRVFHSTERLNDDFFRYLEGKDVSRYSLTWSGEYLKYGDHLAEPRKDFSLFSSNRILVRQIPGKLPYCVHACLTNDVFLNDLNSMNVINIKESPELMLGILNSKLISYWFVHKFGKLQRGTFPQFKTNELAIFPISKNRKKLEPKVVALVNKILELKKKDPLAVTSHLDDEIDNLVYKMYGLTEEEIRTVEGDSAIHAQFQTKSLSNE